MGLISKLPRLVCAQAENANPLYRSYLNNFETFDSPHYRASKAAMDSADGATQNGVDQGDALISEEELS